MMPYSLEGKTVLITGGTGSLGKVLTHRLLQGDIGLPREIIIFSRDEAKQHFMRVSYMNATVVTDEVIYQRAHDILRFHIGDVRDYHSLSDAMLGVDVVFNTAALKQVPTCEIFPYQATLTNIGGAENIVRVIAERHLPVETVIGVSTDKACKPVNVMGMTKAIQERIFIQANMRCSETRFNCVRYGNVLASRGSVIPLFHEQIRTGGPITITNPEMTRFVLTLDQAVDTIFAAYTGGKRGETYIPNVPSAMIIDIANAIISNTGIEIVITGTRPGEKLHEILISEEEVLRTFSRDQYFIIAPILPELRTEGKTDSVLASQYSSGNNLMTFEQVVSLLEINGLLSLEINSGAKEILR